MKRIRRVKKQKVQIDVDWLLGESTQDDVRNHVWLNRAIASLVCVVIAVVAWPYASKQILQLELQKQLAANSGDEALPILLALNDLSPDNPKVIAQQLANEDADRRRVAFQLMQSRISAVSSDPKNQRTNVQTLSQILETVPAASEETLALRGHLAAQLRRLVSVDAPEDSAIREQLDSIIAQAKPNAIAATSTPAPIVSANDLNTNKPSKPTKVRISDSGPNTAPTQTGSSQPTSTSIASTQLPAATTLSSKEETPLRSQSQKLSDQTAFEPPPPSIPTRFASASIAPSNSAQPQSTPIAASQSIPRSVAVNLPPSEPVRLDNRFANKLHSSNDLDTQTLAQPVVRKTESTIAKSIVQSDAPEPMPLRGIEKLSLEQLLPLLASTQPRIVMQASEELMRRGMTKTQLDLVIQLAQGTIEDRLQALDAIVHSNQFDPVPWLVWMAESSDKAVRKKAITLLGSTADQNALRKLRLLKQREVDATIADQINQVLLAAGANRTNTR